MKVARKVVLPPRRTVRSAGPALNTGAEGGGTTPGGRISIRKEIGRRRSTIGLGDPSALDGEGSRNQLTRFVSLNCQLTKRLWDPSSDVLLVTTEVLGENTFAAEERRNGEVVPEKLGWVKSTELVPGTNPSKS